MRCTEGCLPVATGLAQGGASDVKGMQVGQAAHQALDASNLLNCIACQVQVLQLLQCGQGADVSNVAVLHRQPSEALS